MSGLTFTFLLSFVGSAANIGFISQNTAMRASKKCNTYDMSALRVWAYRVWDYVAMCKCRDYLVFSCILI